MDVAALIAKIRAGHDCVQHWLLQRATALVLIPLPFWMAAYAKHLLHSPYAEFAAWLTSPWNAAYIVFSVVVTGYHAVLGIEVILDDYVQWERGKYWAMAVARPAFLALDVAVLAALWFIE